jgi:hypothetical protein
MREISREFMSGFGVFGFFRTGILDNKGFAPVIFDGVA